MKKVLLLVPFTLLAVGCSLDAEIIRASENGPSLYQKVNVIEGVSASHQYTRTGSKGYIVQGSAGASSAKVFIRSNSRGYQLYQGVQGQLISEDPR